MNKYDLVSIVRPTADESIVDSIHKSISEVISMAVEMCQNKGFGREES